MFIIVCTFLIAFLNFNSNSLLLWPDLIQSEWWNYGQVQWWTYRLWLVFFGLGLHLSVLWLMKNGCLEPSPRLHACFMAVWCVASLTPLFLTINWLSSFLMIVALLCLCWSLAPDVLRMQKISLPLAFLISGFLFLFYQLGLDMLDLVWLRAPIWVSWWHGEEMLLLMMSPVFIGIMYGLIESQCKVALNTKVMLLHWVSTLLFVGWVNSFNGLTWMPEIRLVSAIVLVSAMWGGGLYMLKVLLKVRHSWANDSVFACLVAAVLLYLLNSMSIILMSWQGTHGLLSFTFWQQTVSYSNLAGWPVFVILALSFAFLEINTSVWIRWFIRCYFVAAFIFQFASWNAGAIQGIMWRSFGEQADLKYSHLETVQAMPVFYVLQWGASLLVMLACLFFLMQCLRMKPLDKGVNHD